MHHRSSPLHKRFAAVTIIIIIILSMRCDRRHASSISPTTTSGWRQMANASSSTEQRSRVDTLQSSRHAPLAFSPTNATMKHDICDADADARRGHAQMIQPIDTRGPTFMLIKTKLRVTNAAGVWRAEPASDDANFVWLILCGEMRDDAGAIKRRRVLPSKIPKVY